MGMTGYGNEFLLTRDLHVVYGDLEARLRCTMARYVHLNMDGTVNLRSLDSMVLCVLRHDEKMVLFG
jgi:hypothetical protein